MILPKMIPRNLLSAQKQATQKMAHPVPVYMVVLPGIWDNIVPAFFYFCHTRRRQGASGLKPPTLEKFAKIGHDRAEIDLESGKIL